MLAEGVKRVVRHGAENGRLGIHCDTRITTAETSAHLITAEIKASAAHCESIARSPPTAPELGAPRAPGTYSVWLSNARSHAPYQEFSSLSLEQRAKLNAYERIKSPRPSLGCQIDLVKARRRLRRDRAPGVRAVAHRLPEPHHQGQIPHFLGQFQSNKFLRKLIQDPAKPLSPTTESDFKPRY